MEESINILDNTQKTTKAQKIDAQLRQNIALRLQIGHSAQPRNYLQNRICLMHQFKLFLMNKVKNLIKYIEKRVYQLKRSKKG